MYRQPAARRQRRRPRRHLPLPYTDSYPNGHCHGYAEADAHATIRAYAKAASHTGAEALSPL